MERLSLTVEGYQPPSLRSEGTPNRELQRLVAVRCVITEDIAQIRIFQLLSRRY